MDGGLIQSGQMYSYPNLIAAQLGLSPAQFTQPWIAAPGIGSSPASAGNVAGVLYFDGETIAVLDETPLAQVQPTLLLAARQPTQYHNLGVPGATLADGLNAYSAATSQAGNNSFFDFINRASFFGNESLTTDVQGTPVTYQSASMVYQAIAKGGALATFWLGNNDVLVPAMSGEPAEGFGNPGSAGALAFQARYTATLSVLAGGLRQRNYGLKPTIIVANIPSVASTPYFVPKAAFDAFVTSRIGGVWPGGFVESNVQYVLFPALSWILANSPATPIPASLTLDAAETADVNAATGAFNAYIAGIAAAVDGAGVADVAVMDANGLLAGRSTAEKTHFLFLVGQGLTVTQAAATTLFSLDGIHPNPHGYGVVANAFIDVYNAMNPDGEADLEHVDPAALPWDPTYGQAPVKATGRLGLDTRAAAAMDAIFR
jgi:lysophospholipase L1-like esterase